MRGMLSAGEFLELCGAYERPSVRGLRVNLLKIGGCTAGIFGGGFADLSLTPVPWCKTGFIYDSGINDKGAADFISKKSQSPAKSVDYHAGLFYIQEPSAMCPAEALDVQRGHRVLDLCAAPGGKSVQIAGHLQGEGLLVSNDSSPSRCRALVKNLERAGVTNALVLTEQPMNLGRFSGFFDRILVDAPCSGEGMFRREPDAIKAYTSNKPEACAAVQKEILRHAAKLLKPDGKMVYSTCTFNTTENEDVIADFLEKHGDFSLVEIGNSVTDCVGVRNGRGGLSRAVRIFPHEKGEGHFVALLSRGASPLFSDCSVDVLRTTQNINLVGISPRSLDISRTREKFPEFTAFCDEFLNLDFPTHGEFVKNGDCLYFQAVPLDLRGLRVARSGWYLGDCLKGRFVPSQALAMGLRKEQARFSVELSEAESQKYLRGESWLVGGEYSGKPWILVCHKGFPLGWARIVQQRLKNNLPVGWAVKH